MKYPNFREEKKLWRKGYKRVAGLDEAGRGPLAGPVVAAALIIRPNIKYKKSKTKIKKKKIGNLTIKQFNKLGIRDSKKITPREREELYDVLTNHPQIEWATARVSEKVIDRINILEATRLAMKRAVQNLEKKTSKKRAEFLLLDGRMNIDLDVPQKSIIGADNKVFSCAAASIVAKVNRDRMMKRYHKKYPHYGFLQHKGYATYLHLKMLKKHSPSPIHRISFKPIRKA